MKALLLDLDDTLVDRRVVFDAWLSEWALSDEDRAWVRVLDDRGMCDRAVFWGGLAERLQLADSVGVLVERWELEFPARYRCAPGVVELLGEARASGWRLGVVTNGKTAVQTRKLEAAGLVDLVDAICISEAEGVRKPDARIFARALQRMGAAAAESWMVGDNPMADIGGARDAGLRTAWVSGGLVWPEAEPAPDLRAVDVADALGQLLQP